MFPKFLTGLHNMSALLRCVRGFHIIFAYVYAFKSKNILTYFIFAYACQIYAKDRSKDLNGLETE